MSNEHARGVERVCIGHETSEVLQIVPASFVVERHLREKLACKAPAYTRPGATAIEVACWAHGGRGFAELVQAGDARAVPMIKLIGRLYEIEAAATAEQVDHDERLQRRLVYSAPITMEIGALCAQIINTTPPKDDLARAAGYLVNQWTALRRFLEDGRLPIDNTI